jgi:hypothetical protein
MKYLYRHLYDSKGRPVVTICTLEQNKTYARGIAICSPLDIKAGNLSKKRGRQIARGRAERAMDKGQTWGSIRGRAYENADGTGIVGMFLEHINLCKCIFPAKLDTYEKVFFAEAA